MDPSIIHAARVERYKLKQVVSDIFPASKTARCGVYVAPGCVPQIWRSALYNSAFFVGLLTCASVWVCPLCASKISERRRVDLQGAIDRWVVGGGGVALMTATFPHGPADPLRDLLRRMLAAWRALTHSRRGGALRAMFGVVGIVRGVEVTHGINGWHPHIHALLFLDRPLDEARRWTLRAEYSAAWQHVCLSAGLRLPDDWHGLQVDDGARASAYLAQSGHWGAAGEMTKGHLKRARGAHYSPWDLLRVYANSGDRAARALFEEYGAAFHGARQLFYSKELKGLLGLDAASDANVAAARVDSGQLVFSIPLDLWRYIRDSGDYPGLLRMAESSPGNLDYYFRLISKS